MAGLEITEVRVRPYSKSDDKLKAFSTLTFNESFVITDLKIIRGKKGLFVAMPSRKRKDGTFKDVAHPLNNETRQMIERAILEEYERVLSKGTQDDSAEGGLDTSSFSPEKESGQMSTTGEEIEDEFKDV